MRPNGFRDLLARVAVGPLDSCWEWQGRTGSGGYGVIEFRGATCKAHRLMWVLCNGPISGGLFVCHSCDNPRCCNPAHLFLGTQWDNMRDMAAKGRHGCGDMRGEKNPQSKLAPEQVAEMRKLRRATGLSFRAIGRRFGVSRATAHRACACETWETVGEE